MNINKITIIGSVIAIVLIITVPTIYKVIKTHNDTLYQVVEDKIIEAAKKCYYEDQCINEKIYLKDLYKLEYLEALSDPITKEYYNVESYVLREELNFVFVVVE